MALKKCKECGGEVSTKAAACPKCGAKVVRTSGCAWLVLILFGLLIIPPMFSGFNGARDRAEARASGASITPTPTTKIAASSSPVVSTIKDPFESLPSATPTPTPSNWEYEHSDYAMGKGRIHQAFNVSTNLVLFGFPYNEPQHGQLTLRTHPKFGKSVILSIRRGQFLVRGYEDSKAMVRFDDGEQINYSVAGPEDLGTTTAFFRDYQGFVERMLKAKRVRIAVPVYQQGSPVFEFDVTGFDAAAYAEKKP